MGRGAASGGLGLVLVRGSSSRHSQQRLLSANERWTVSPGVSICLPEAACTVCPRAANPSVGVFFSFRRKWAFPVNCWNRTSSNAAWDFLS